MIFKLKLLLLPWFLLSVEQIDGWLEIIPELFNTGKKSDLVTLSFQEFLFASNNDKNDEKPNLLIRNELDWVTIGIIYDNPKQFKDLRNFINLKNNYLYWCCHR